ncbi:MAG: MgtC/SapB family protein [Actinomycetaceae bacterium]|nr:MgtC/SapB family protein [Actinomycetaceae bacterium]
MFEGAGLDALRVQFVALTVCFVLCALLGIERQVHHKNAGFKTHILVGVGSCIFTLVSAYGFHPLLHSTVNIDPTRIAAQIVSGIGFIGAGVIFVNNDMVRGLTTAATIWLSAALGVACGAYMFPLAIYALLLHYLMVFVLTPLAGRIPSRGRGDRILLEYEVGSAVMRKILTVATERGYKTTVSATKQLDTGKREIVRAVLKFEGPRSKDALIDALASIPGMRSVEYADADALE